MLQVQQLHQYYGGSHILRGLSFDAKVGEVTCLLGRNGVGKTTLLKCLMGLIPAKDGSVTWEEQNITSLKPHQRVHAGIAYVPQGREIFGRLTVEENLLMGLSRFPGSQAKEVPAFIYELFPVLEEMKLRRGGDLSGGQQQQLAIGRALASQPRLLTSRRSTSCRATIHTRMGLIGIRVSRPAGGRGCARAQRITGRSDGSVAHSPVLADHC